MRLIRRFEPSLNGVIRFTSKHITEGLGRTQNVPFIKSETCAFGLTCPSTPITTHFISIIALFDGFQCAIATQPAQASDDLCLSPDHCPNVLLITVLRGSAVFDDLKRPITDGVNVSFNAPGRNEGFVKVHTVADMHLANITTKRRAGDPRRQCTNTEVSNIECVREFASRIPFVGQRPIQVQPDVLRHRRQPRHAPIRPAGRTAFGP